MKNDEIFIQKKNVLINKSIAKRILIKNHLNIKIVKICFFDKTNYN